MDADALCVILNNISICEDDYSIKTTDEWIKLCGYDLKPGESVMVKGKKDEIYKVTRSKKIPESVYCSCPAWKYQRLNPVIRTCKHCVAVCGKEAEELRVKNNKK